jgi:TolA-binding protein
MSDPRRLLDQGANDFEAKLLRAGRRDAPSARNRRRVLAGLGLGSVLSTSVVASAGGSKALSSGALGALRWVGGGAVSVLAVWTGVQAFAPAKDVVSHSANRPAVALVQRAKPASPATTLSAPTVPETSAQAPSAAKPLSAARAAGPAATQERGRDSLSAELAALDRARSALASRDTQLALRLLDEYAQRFPKRRLNTEAAVLRIEALAARGDRASAARLGKEFLARQPNGPYARRVSSLIAEPLPSAKAER